MTDIEQALAEALLAYRVDGKYQVWDDLENAEEYFGTPQELAHGMAATEPMQAIARRAALADQLAEALRSLMVSDAIIDTADEYDLITSGSWPGPYIEARAALAAHDSANTPPDVGVNNHLDKEMKGR